MSGLVLDLGAASKWFAEGIHDLKDINIRDTCDNARVKDDAVIIWVMWRRPKSIFETLDLAFQWI